MKYGTDRTPIDAAEHSFLQAIGQQQKTRWYLWIDSAFDIADETAACSAPSGVNVYQVDEMLALQPLGPRIVPVFSPGDDATTVRQRLRPWLEHCSGRPMLSLLASDHDEQVLAQHMREWSWAQTPEQETVLLRLADTRSICMLRQVLTPPQWHGLTEPFLHWLYINRKGEVGPLIINPGDAPGATAPPLVLSEEQVQAMTLASEPDALLHHFATETPEVIPPDVLPSRMHFYLQEVLKLAHTHDVDHFSDRLTLLLSACATKGQSIKDRDNLVVLINRQHPRGQLAAHWSAHQ